MQQLLETPDGEAIGIDLAILGDRPGLLVFRPFLIEKARLIIHRFERFRKMPKPMYYQPRFLDEKWAEYKKSRSITEDREVDPDGFAIWGFEQLLHHRIPLYQAIARNFGYSVKMEDVPKVKTEEDFLALVSRAIDKS